MERYDTKYKKYKPGRSEIRIYNEYFIISEIEERVKVENRNSKIDSIINGTEFIEKTVDYELANFIFKTYYDRQNLL